MEWMHLYIYPCSIHLRDQAFDLGQDPLRERFHGSLMLLLTYDIPSTSWRHEPLADDKFATNKTARSER